MTSIQRPTFAFRVKVLQFYSSTVLQYSTLREERILKSSTLGEDIGVHPLSLPPFSTTFRAKALRFAKAVIFSFALISSQPVSSLLYSTLYY
jgi:hypothetical protein